MKCIATRNRTVVLLMCLLYYVLYTSVYCDDESVVKRQKSCDLFETPNVRSVLFHKGDLKKDCWGLDQVGLLFNRYLMQNLLPRKLPSNMTLFLNYIVICLQSLEDTVMRSERSNQYVLETMADTFGGYLQAFVLPIVNQEYYEGKIDYRTCADLHLLQKDFMKILKTDGGGWSKPVKPKKLRGPLPLLHLTEVNNACEKILFGDDEDAVNQVLLSKPENWLSISISGAPVTVDPMSICSDKNSTIRRIPMPFLDDCKQPNAIAVPLRNCSLYNLSKCNSRDILLKYYATSMSCIRVMCLKSTKENCKWSKSEFNKMVYNFLRNLILPRLKDDKWYPAFSKILPLYETVKRAASISNLDNVKCDDNKNNKLLDRIENQLLLYMFTPIGIVFMLLLVNLILMLCCILIYMAKRSKNKVDECTDDELCMCEMETVKCDEESPLNPVRESSPQTTLSDCLCPCGHNEENIDETKHCDYCTCHSKIGASLEAQLYREREPLPQYINEKFKTQEVSENNNDFTCNIETE